MISAMSSFKVIRLVIGASLIWEKGEVQAVRAFDNNEVLCEVIAKHEDRCIRPLVPGHGTTKSTKLNELLVIQFDGAALARNAEKLLGDVRRWLHPLHFFDGRHVTENNIVGVTGLGWRAALHAASR
jgi:hypothetical protein